MCEAHLLSTFQTGIHSPYERVTVATVKRCLNASEYSEHIHNSPSHVCVMQVLRRLIDLAIQEEFQTQT